MSDHRFMIRKAAVLGAGVMGAPIAAHLVNANVETLLFELPADAENPNANVTRAIERLKKLEPSPLSVISKSACIHSANYDQHLGSLTDCDLVIEAIAERVDWKTELYAKIVPYLAPHTLLASNTSGLSINQLAAALPQELQMHRHLFCRVVCLIRSKVLVPGCQEKRTTTAVELSFPPSALASETSLLHASCGE